MSDHDRFVDRTWVCTTIAGSPVDPAGDQLRSFPEVRFGGDGALSGFAGVNRLMGRWHLDDGVLVIDGPATTMMAGPPSAMTVEQRFLRSLGTGGPLRHDGDRLAIGDDLTFAAEPVAAGQWATIEGTAAYRERIAMPHGAVMTVQLLDVSRQDVAAGVVAESVIEQPGNVPVPFTVTYDPARIDPRHSYAVSGRITVEGELWWITTDRYAVPADGAPARVDLRLQRVDRTPER